MFFRRVVDLALTQDTRDEFLCNLRIFGFLLLVLLALFSRFLQAAFHAPRLMRSGCPPKSSEEVVESADAGCIIRGKAAENGINGRCAECIYPFIHTHPKLGQE